MLRSCRVAFCKFLGLVPLYTCSDFATFCFVSVNVKDFDYAMFLLRFVKDFGIKKKFSFNKLLSCSYLHVGPSLNPTLTVSSSQTLFLSPSVYLSLLLYIKSITETLSPL
ncbi:hypothetical protein GOODEAATRI_032828 [Goodea atripinnis]|uniref:Uncharacterized protein n=1 Tax=Goodea atripinnis TaxID=208336 RepID=A0ABV0NZQ6_9TELE